MTNDEEFEKLYEEFLNVRLPTIARSGQNKFIARWFFDRAVTRQDVARIKAEALEKAEQGKE